MDKFSDVFDEFGRYDRACFANLSGIIKDYKATHKVLPEWVSIGYNVLDMDISGYDDEDDWYEAEEEDSSGCFSALTVKEVRDFCFWAFTNKLHPKFDVKSFLMNKAYTVPFGWWKDINSLYWSLSLMRYMHEGQGLCRRIVALDKEYGLDPFVNIILSHYLANSKYNGGHAIADMTFWFAERYGRFYGDRRPEERRVTQNYLYRIAKASRKLLNEKHTGFGRDYDMEQSLKKYESALPELKYPKTWRGLLKKTT
jgi:hypothetical protein